MTTNIIGLFGAGVLALGYLCLVHARESWGRSALKTGAVFILALMAALKMPLLAVALGLCALGDLALSRPGERAFLAGVASFAAGHLAYVWLFCRCRGRTLSSWQLRLCSGPYCCCF